MRTRLKLQSKGFLVVAVPLLFMFVLTAVLIYQIDSARLKQEELAHIRALVAAATKLGHAFQRSFVFTYAGSFFGRPAEDKVVANRYRRFRDDMRSAELELKAASLKVDGSRVVVDRVCWQMAEVGGLLDRVMFDVPKGERMALMTERRAQLEGVGARLREIIERYESVDRRSAFVMEEANGRIVETVVVGTVVNLLLALALGAYVSRDISRRVEQLSANTLRFAANEKLLPEVGGRDEIAELDHAFRQTVQLLEDSEVTRKRFYSALTAEMKAPIANVLSLISSILDTNTTELPGAAVERFARVRKNLDRLVLLVDDLENTENVTEGGTFEPVRKAVQGRDLLEKAAHLLEAIAQEKKMSVSTGGDDLQLFADEGMLLRVLVNFLSNAIKYCPCGSEIHLRCAEAPDGTVKFEVADNGPGISPEGQARLFGKFEQMSAEHGRRGAGTGLGLASCKAIVEAHGGVVGVESELGRGSNFWFSVPREPGEVNLETAAGF